MTSVPRWQTAVKALWDNGAIADDVVVCTGSSAVDLQRGAAERLPGRRGAGRDHLVLPQTAASFACALDKSIPPSPRVSIADLCTDAGKDLLLDSRIHGPALEDTLSRYLLFGGLPAAVAEATAGAREPSEQVKRVLYESLLKDLQREGASIPAARALLARVLRSLGSRTDWSKLAREMDVPTAGRGELSRHALRGYVELLTGGYFLFILYFWRAGAPTNNLSSEKKIFFSDPLLHTIALELLPGVGADMAALVENAVAVALYRRYEPVDRLIESFACPDNLHAWRTARQGEIDFVAGPRRGLDAVEVKFRNKVDLRSAYGVAKAHPGRPAVIATRNELRFARDFVLVPTHTLLWALG